MTTNVDEIAAGAKGFNDTADSYEEGNGGCTTAIASQLAQLCSPITSDSYILDCAAGPGIVIDALLDHNGPDATGARYAVLEPAPKMMEVHHKIATKWGIPAHNITTFIKPAEDLGSLGISPNQFSHVFSNCGIMLFSDPRAAARNMYQLLMPNGVALITTFAHIGYIPPVAKVCEQIRPGEDPFHLFDSESWYEASHLEKLLRNAGFRDVEMQTMEAPLTRSSLGVLAESVVENFVGMWQEKGWTEEEFKTFTKALEPALLQDKENVSIDEAGVHARMTAHIAICKR